MRWFGYIRRIKKGRLRKKKGDCILLKKVNIGSCIHYLKEVNIRTPNEKLTIYH
jgi:hypothetical protein